MWDSFTIIGNSKKEAYEINEIIKTFKIKSSSNLIPF